MHIYVKVSYSKENILNVIFKFNQQERSWYFIYTEKKHLAVYIIIFLHQILWKPESSNQY